jgi:hypothetical protein
MLMGAPTTQGAESTTLDALSQPIAHATASWDKNIRKRKSPSVERMGDASNGSLLPAQIPQPAVNISARLLLRPVSGLLAKSPLHGRIEALFAHILMWRQLWLPSVDHNGTHRQRPSLWTSTPFSRHFMRQQSTALAFTINYKIGRHQKIIQSTVIVSLMMISTLRRFILRAII